jgi:hypothetical protein
MLLPCLWHDSSIVPTTLANGAMFGDTTLSINIVVALLVLHEVLLHGFPSPSPSFLLSLQNFHVIVVKKNCYHLWFPFIDNLKTYTIVQCANNKCKRQHEKALCKMFKPFRPLSQKGLHRKRLLEMVRALISNLTPFS